MSEIQLTDAQQYTDNIIANLTSYAYLTQPQKIVLVKMIESITSDLAYTDVEIANRAGVSVSTVKNCRQNAHFLSCLSESTRNQMKSEAPEVIRAIKKKAIEGSVRAQDLFIRYTGDFIPKSQVESKSQNLNKNINLNAGEAIGDFVALLCDKGWNRDRIHEEIDRVYDELKEQGRVI